MTTRSASIGARVPAPRSASDAVPALDLRALASTGALKAAAALPGTRAALVGQAYEVVTPVVFAGHTRRIERSKGHGDCAASVWRLRSECHDAFLDDVAAVIDHLLGSANGPIVNLEGWVASRIRVATVDAHRRRRGGRGAQQRPRVPNWLAADLGGDAWLVLLAERILEWVGVEATAGMELWPLDAWAELRAAKGGGERAVDAGATARDVETVLAAMRSGRPTWFDRYVERPLGRKKPPVAPAPVDEGGTVPEQQALQLTKPEDRDEALLAELAGLALDVIGTRLAAGEDAGRVVPAVLGRMFSEILGEHRDDAAVDPDAALPDPACASLVAEVVAILGGAPTRGAQRLDQVSQPRT